MNLLVFSLVLFCVLAAVAVVYLYVRLRRKETASAAEIPQRNASADALSATLESAAIDQYLYDRCCRYMTERKPFLVPGFSLQDLATAVYTNKAYISRTINQLSGKNFRQYVNYYRIMYAMELFKDNMSLRVTELSELSGFHSTTAFFQSFKKVMGEAPSIWCARIRKSHNSAMKK